MIRESLGRPVVGMEPVELPLKILQAIGKDATTRWKQPLFDVLAAAEALLGSRDNVERVLRPKIWASDWKPEQFPEHRLPDFLGIAGDVGSEKVQQAFDVIHCICGFGSSPLGDPLLSLGRLIQTGMLRDALVEAGTRLLILQSFEDRPDSRLLSERMAEFIVGAGGPTVLVVAGGEMEPLNRYLVGVYSAVLRNLPLEEIAHVEIPGSKVLLLHGEGGTRLLQFDSLMESLGERLSDYAKLIPKLLSGISDPAQLAHVEPKEVRLLKDLHPRVDATLRSLRDFKVRGWDETHQGVLLLAKIAESVETINRDIDWHTGEGALHTRFDMLEYRLNLPIGYVPESWKEEPLVEPFTEITVFFGTNRSKAREGVYYGIDRDSMHYGRCLLSVPVNRNIGTVPRPSIWTLYRADRTKHFLIQDIAEDNHADFLQNLRQYLGACSSNDVLLFVHGFNVDFVSAILRTAQIAADLTFPGASLLFSWPSKGSLSPLAYTHDEAQTRWALRDLREFLELVAEESGAGTIHLLAHSMGNRALTEALGRIGAATSRRGGTTFNEIVLTAPDIDTDTFVHDIAPVIVPTAKRVTLYASSKDMALAFSKTVHGYDRAGESGEKIVLLDGVDTIDVSAIDTNLVGHFYYGDNRSVLSDMFNLIKGQPATDRFGLKKRTKDRRPYWVFSP
jgi:esterase/lipase superfamily enzyme